MKCVVDFLNHLCNTCTGAHKAEVEEMRRSLRKDTFLKICYDLDKFCLRWNIPYPNEGLF